MIKESTRSAAEWWPIRQNIIGFGFLTGFADERQHISNAVKN